MIEMVQKYSDSHKMSVGSLIKFADELAVTIRSLAHRFDKILNMALLLAELDTPGVQYAWCVIIKYIQHFSKSSSGLFVLFSTTYSRINNQ